MSSAAIDMLLDVVSVIIIFIIVKVIIEIIIKIIVPIIFFFPIPPAPIIFLALLVCWLRTLLRSGRRFLRFFLIFDWYFYRLLFWSFWVVLGWLSILLFVNWHYLNVWCYTLWKLFDFWVLGFIVFGLFTPLNHSFVRAIRLFRLVSRWAFFRAKIDNFFLLISWFLVGSGFFIDWNIFHLNWQCLLCSLNSVLSWRSIICNCFSVLFDWIWLNWCIILLNLLFLFLFDDVLKHDRVSFRSLIILFINLLSRNDIVN